MRFSLAASPIRLLFGMLSLFVLSCFAFPLPVKAASTQEPLPRGVVQLDPASLKQQRWGACGEIERGKWVPGRAIGEGYFYPHAAEVKNLQSRISKARSGERKKLERSLRTLRKALSSRNQLCQQSAQLALALASGPNLIALQGFSPFDPQIASDDFYSDNNQGAVQGGWVILWGRFSKSSVVLTSPATGVVESFVQSPALNQINVKLKASFKGEATFSVVDSRGRSKPMKLFVREVATPVGVYLDLNGQTAYSLSKTYDGEYIALFSNGLFNEFEENVLVDLPGSVKSEGIHYQGKNQINIKLRPGEVVTEPRSARIGAAWGGASNRPLIQPKFGLQVLPQPKILSATPASIESCGERTEGENVVLVSGYNKSESPTKLFCSSGVAVEVAPGESRSVAVVVPFEKSVECQIGSRTVLTVSHRRRASCGAATSQPSLLGVYNWYGRLSESSAATTTEVLDDNFALLSQLNSSQQQPGSGIEGEAPRGVIQSIRVSYHSECSALGVDRKLPTLLERLEEERFKNVFGDPYYRTIMLTAYERSVRPRCDSNDFTKFAVMNSPEVLSATSEEVREFVRALYERYGELDKTIVLSHWEGDNSLYCGAYYSYLTNPQFRTECDQNYGAWYGGNSGPAETVQAMTQWFAARQKGLEQARREVARFFPEAKLRVVHAPEINSVFLLQQNNLPNLLHSSLLSAPESYDAVSYSAWEWIGSQQSGITSYLEEIQSVSGGKPLVLGEFGWSCNSDPTSGRTPDESERECVQQTERQLQEFEAARESHNVVAAFLWGVSGDQYGLLREDGSPRLLHLLEGGRGKDEGDGSDMLLPEIAQ